VIMPTIDFNVCMITCICMIMCICMITYICTETGILLTLGKLLFTFFENDPADESLT
jgi:hypothetical protein